MTLRASALGAQPPGGIWPEADDPPSERQSTEAAIAAEVRAPTPDRLQRIKLSSSTTMMPPPMIGSAMAKTFTTEKERRSRSHMNVPISARSDAIAARRVLRDCHISVRRYGSATEGADRRIAWATVVTLLRAVGHVLDKVDGSRSNFLRAAIDECWSKIRAGAAEHEIFHDFIERERNNVLKEYRAGEARVELTRSDLPQVDDLLIGSRLLSMEKALQETLRWWEVLLGRVEDGAHRRLVMGRDMDARWHHPPR